MLDPIGDFLRIRDFYITYLETAFHFRDERISKQRRALLEQWGTLCAEPFFEPLFEYERITSQGDELKIEDLVEHRSTYLEGLEEAAAQAFAELAKAGLIGDYELYAHQIEMLSRGVKPGHPGIVTSGTGSGKTESFLMPIFASLTREARGWEAPDTPEEPWFRRHDTKPTGTRAQSAFVPRRAHERRPAAVRALILYPMNALVEDQLVRLRKALDSPDAHDVYVKHFQGNALHFGRYTSKTPVTGFAEHPRLGPDCPDFGDDDVIKAQKHQKKRHETKVGQMWEHLRELCAIHESLPPDEEGKLDDARSMFARPERPDGRVPAEVVTRWDMQAHPPDILITNTSMLSAMLMREVEEPIFDKTRRWLEDDDEAYFYLVIDELHLQRGSAGTEVAHLLEVLVRRVGLDRPEHRHKLRILASSASLESTGELKEPSAAYLWDMFGRMGTYEHAGHGGFEGPLDWVEGKRAAIVPGEPRHPGTDLELSMDPTPLLELYDHLVECLPEDTLAPHATPFEVLDLEQAHEHLVAISRELTRMAGAVHVEEARGYELLEDIVERTAHTLASACESEDGSYETCGLSTMAGRLFEAEALERAEEVGLPPASLRGLRVLTYLRGLGDLWLSDERDGGPSGPRMRVHTFFRNLDGLFASVDGERPAVRGTSPWVSELTVERGRRYEDPDQTREQRRLYELIYCECCGELFVGGLVARQDGHRQSSYIELCLSDPDLEGLPDANTSNYFEAHDASSYAVFWPAPEGATPHASERKKAHQVECWIRARFDPRTGFVRTIQGSPIFDSTPASRGLDGFVFERSPGKDPHKRGQGDEGTHVPYACPSCSTDYAWRKREHRLSPLRNFRAGFGKTTQLLASELHGIVTLEATRPSLKKKEAKLVSFSDSRQDAANAALDIQRRHYEDMLRERLRHEIEQAASSAREHREEARESVEEWRELVELAREKGRSFDKAREAYEQAQAELAELDSAMTSSEHIRESRPMIRMADVVERAGTEKVGPLMSWFVARGIHPGDPRGIKKYTSQEERRRWDELFDWRAENVQWSSRLNSSDLNPLKQLITGDTYRRLAGIIFSKTYFSLEESGLARPVISRRTDENHHTPGENALAELDCHDAFIRILTDSYRYTPSIYGSNRPTFDNFDQMTSSRTRRVLLALHDGDEAATRTMVNTALRRLKEDGHHGGYINLPDTRLVTTRPHDPFWRCHKCGRIHLVLAWRRCTRCLHGLEDRASGQVHELWREHFLTKRALRSPGIERLRCEELTGQTSHPVRRQRLFRSIVIDSIDNRFLRENEDGEVDETILEGAESPHVIDLLAVTTTMEVGIDIGDLSAIFQANMPPQRFNYQQRVGRAGRRGQAFNMALTVCRSKSHDLFYFRHPDRITNEPPPVPFLTRELVEPARRFVRKTWLRSAFVEGREHATGQEPWRPDLLVPPDIHGEFVPANVYEEDPSWKMRLRQWLEATVAERDELLAFVEHTHEDRAGSVVPSAPVDSCALRIEIDELLEEIDAAVANESSRKEGLAHTLADAGAFPMFGMPTRVRYLFHGLEFEGDESSLEWLTIDRDLDMAIYEFAPGARLVKDKREIRPAGFIGPLHPRVRAYRGYTEISPLDVPFTTPRQMVECSGCRTMINVSSSSSSECPSCQEPLPLEQARQVIEPLGFIASFQEDSDEPSEGTSRHRTIVAEAAGLDFSNVARTRPLVLFEQQMKTMRLNKGRWRASAQEEDGYFEGFDASPHDFSLTRTKESNRKKKSFRLKGAMLHPDHVEHFRKAEPSSNLELDPIEQAWLVSPKTTDGLFLTLEEIPEAARLDPHESTSVRAAALSALFLLVSDASRELDLDPEEFDVIEPRVRLNHGHLRVPLLQITDRLVNGAGYCRRLATPRQAPWILERLDALLDGTSALLMDYLSDEHMSQCYTSCYECMQRYGNQGYHGLLDWRLGLAYLHALRRPQDFSTQLTNLLDSGVVWAARWKEHTSSYVSSMARTYEDIEEGPDTLELPVFLVSSPDGVQRGCAPIHPLLELSAAIDREGSMLRAWERAERWARDETRAPLLEVDSFELARRTMHVRSRLQQGLDVRGSDDG